MLYRILVQACKHIRYAGFQENFLIIDKDNFLLKSSAGVYSDTSIAALRNYRDACNLTGRFNLSSANCVTFLGRREKTTMVLIGRCNFVRFGNYLQRNEGLAA